MNCHVATWRVPPLRNGFGPTDANLGLRPAIFFVEQEKKNIPSLCKKNGIDHRSS